MTKLSGHFFRERHLSPTSLCLVASSTHPARPKRLARSNRSMVVPAHGAPGAWRHSSKAPPSKTQASTKTSIGESAKGPSGHKQPNRLPAPIPDPLQRDPGRRRLPKGIWRGPRTKNPWPILNEIHSPALEASDHAAIWVDLNLWPNKPAPNATGSKKPWKDRATSRRTLLRGQSGGGPRIGTSWYLAPSPERQEPLYRAVPGLSGRPDLNRRGGPPQAYSAPRSHLSDPRFSDIP